MFLYRLYTNNTYLFLITWIHPNQYHPVLNNYVNNKDRTCANARSTKIFKPTWFVSPPYSQSRGVLLLCKAVSAGQGRARCVVELSTGLRETLQCPEKVQRSSLINKHLIVKVLVGAFNKAKVPIEVFSGHCEISLVAVGTCAV